MIEKKDDTHGKTRVMEDDEFVRESETQRLKSMFPGKTEAEYVKINRNFLKDAEPFNLARLINDMKNAPEDLRTGFKVYDHYFHLPGGAITLITGGPKQGKSLFMMNMMLNMVRQYRGKHFIYYTYEENRKDIELKLINMLGKKPFDNPAGGKAGQEADKAGIKTNLEFWKNRLKTLHEAELLKAAAEDDAYSGLSTFLDLADRIHIVDKNYSISHLIESIKLFNGPFLVGAVFVDFIQKIQHDKGSENQGLEERLLEISDSLRQFVIQMNFPLIIGSQIIRAEVNEYEDESFSGDSLSALKGLEQDASLIIELQQPKKNPDTILTRVLANRNGIKVEAELKFDRKLLKISDLA
jgi:replicative DNA helicase